MILLWAVGLSIVVALLQGGQLTGLAELRLRCGWLALVSLSVQIAAVYLPWEGLTYPGHWPNVLLVTSYGLLLAVVVLNHQLPGMRVMGLGLLLNLVVIVVNGGFMPVAADTLQRAGLEHLVTGNEAGARLLSSKDILLARHETNLWFLGDIFVIPQPFGTVYSVGDVLLALGAFLFFQRTLVSHQAGSAPAIN